VAGLFYADEIGDDGWQANQVVLAGELPSPFPTFLGRQAGVGACDGLIESLSTSFSPSVPLPHTLLTVTR